MPGTSWYMLVYRYPRRPAAFEYFRSAQYCANITHVDTTTNYMTLFITAVAAILLYFLAAFRLGQRFITASASPPTSGLRITSLAALILHGIILYQLIATDSGINMGFYNALSLISWAVALLILVTSLIKPVENLAMVVFPATALALLLSILFPSRRLLPDSANIGLDIHIILSIAAYSLLTVAALQALILAVQEHQLKSNDPVRAVRILPPMQTMEELLVQLLWLGYFLLSLSLATGLMFVHDFLDQHLAHKTVLSIVAWLIFSTVLFGRWAWGWRGKHLIRWTLGGFLMLMLAYFGSKFVLELVLRRV